MPTCLPSGRQRRSDAPRRRWSLGRTPGFRHRNHPRWRRLGPLPCARPDPRARCASAKGRSSFRRRKPRTRQCRARPRARRPGPRARARISLPALRPRRPRSGQSSPAGGRSSRCESCAPRRTRRRRNVVVRPARWISARHPALHRAVSQHRQMQFSPVLSCHHPLCCPAL